MKTSKKFIAVAAMSFALFGCAAPQTTDQASAGAEGTSSVDIAFNGVEMTCAIYNAYEAGGLECDWSGKRPAQPGTSTDPLNGALFHRVLKTSQGDVDCMVYDEYKSGSIDCDFPIKK